MYFFSELIYCGQKLQDDKVVDSYGLKPGCTVFALKKHVSEPLETNKPESMSDLGLRRLVSTLQTALLNPAYRQIVEKMLNNPEAIENIMAATPGLENDPVSIAMLQDPELLAILAHPGNIQRVVQRHPAFSNTATLVATAVSNEGSKLEGDRASTGTYSMDQMSDEEDVMPNRSGQPSTSNNTVGGSGITASQLTAALAAATGMSPQTSSVSDTGVASNLISSGDMGSGITTDFFQQAIRQAQSATNDTQIEQLRDMGIHDEALARRALQATGGDLQAALDLIFGDGHF